MVALKSKSWQMAVAILIMVHLGPCLALAFNQTRSIEPLGLVTPLPTDCGGGNTATFHELHVSGCTAQPCLMKPSSFYDILAIYTPAYSSNTLVYVIYFYPSSGSRVNLLISEVDGSITAGRRHDLSYEILIPTSMAGKTGQIEIFLLDVERSIFYRCFDISISAA